ncbi:hypothetical protein Rhal01_03371 [Rubritalea halochordaticola]|uniref:Uncharacterized protein n=1 Tax=Rubritalea halochordaticola TaxID=714537 RepID=A0ABP9V800_9BACT
MNKLYSGSVILFGLVAPLIVALIALLVISSIKSSLLGDFKKNKLAYQQEQAIQQQITALKNQTAPQLTQFNQWQDLVSDDVYQKISSGIREQASMSPTQTMMITSESRSQAAKNIENILKRNIVGIDIALNGTYKEIQSASLSLETASPNLFLHSFKLTPGRGKLLDLNLTYLAWAKD